MNIFKMLDKNGFKVIRLLSRGDFYLREIASTLKISTSVTHSTIKKLLNLEFVEISKEKNRKIVFLKRENLLLQKVKSFINLNELLSSKAYFELSRVGVAGIYGSFADGSNDEHSDLDLWVYAERMDPAKVSKISSIFEKELKVETNILILNKDKLQRIKNKDPEFYSRIKFTSIFEGEGIFD
ncbi:MAG: nucleotidyltransferase domain-containing protein [Candidatus Margulisiibacteriota bacterium]|nr:nucleotidyltransferase domain-containing protein [Candidatus Margulisiibacteriota bacterium]